MKLKLTEKQYNTLLEFIGEENKKPEQPSTDNQEKPEVDSNDAKAMVHAITSDPSMRTAFYKKPTLWNMISKAFKGEKRSGTGVVPGRDITSKYNLASLINSLGDYVYNFSFNKHLSYVLISNDVHFDKITYKTNNRYSALVNNIDYANKYMILKDSANTEIQIKSTNSIGDKENTFNARFINEVKNENGEIVKKAFECVITIDSKRSSGYYNYKRHFKNFK